MTDVKTDEQAEEDALARIRSVPRVEPTNEITFPKATLLAAPGQAGSASGGAKGSLKFEVETGELGAFLQLGIAGQAGVRVRWDKYELGDMSVASWGGRPDEDGSARSYLTFAVPQTGLAAIAQLYKAVAFGRTSTLVLDPAQASMEEVLATKA